jgi:butyryl-CoA dehydrogenase
MVTALQTALSHLKSTTEVLLGGMMQHDIDLVMANSAKYLEFFGHVVIGWMWLRQGLVASDALTHAAHSDDTAFYKGKLQSMLYFARWELPQTQVWAELLSDMDDTTYAMEAAWF